MIKQNKLIYLSFLITFLFPLYAHALEAVDIVRNLPKKYSGYFQWQQSSGVAVTVDINEINIDEEGNVVAIGRDSYNSNGRITELDVKLKIIPATLSFEMWESNPDSKWRRGRSFVTDSSHIGRISEDLESIKAVYTTKGRKPQKGDLVLHSK